MRLNKSKDEFPLMQAIFLDRDGVINRERSDYVKNWSEFEFLPGALDAIARLTTLRRPIVVITNQSPIGRGIVAESEIHQIHRKMRINVERAAGRIDAFFVCPHHPDAGCGCRKPKPGLLLQAAAQFHLDLEECLFIGDSITDFQAAQAVGCQSILVRSGRQGPKLRQMLDGSVHVPLMSDLSAATEHILAKAPTLS